MRWGELEKRGCKNREKKSPLDDIREDAEFPVYLWRRERRGKTQKETPSKAKGRRKKVEEKLQTHSGGEIGLLRVAVVLRDTPEATSEKD